MQLFTPILFHRPNNLLSKAIRMVTGSYWNHCGAIFLDKDGDLMFIESVEGGTKIWLWSEAKTYYDKFNCEYKFCYEREMVRNYKKKLNAGYEYFKFIREPFYYLSCKVLGNDSKITKWLSNLDDPTRFVCFELISYLQGDSKPWGATGFRFDNKKNNS